MPDKALSLLLKEGRLSKLVEHRSYPLTGLACVDRVYTDLAMFEITPEGVAAHDICADLDFAELARLPLINSRS